MSLASPWYLLVLPIGSAVFAMLPGAWCRRAWLTLLSLAFLWAQLTDWTRAVTLAGFLLSGYAVALTLRRWPRRFILATYIILSIAAFIYLKRYSFLELVLPDSWLHHAIGIVGLSYILFRQIHFLVDVAQGQIAELSLLSYLNYQLSLFTLQAGPIQRYQDFSRQWSTAAPCLSSRDDVLLAYLRVLVGFGKIMLADACLFGRAHALETLPTLTELHLTLAVVGRLVVLFYGFPVYVFLNFSGYCDMAIGGASLVGMKLPENFNHPYLARNMIEFWQRWHITLSTWIRDYIFTPLYMFLATRRPSAAWASAAGCYFVAFFLAGVWHGSTYGFAVFGLLHGLGVASVKLWETLIIRRRGRAGLREYLQVRPVRHLAILATFHFACATFLVFPGGTDLAEILKSIVLARLCG
jgi:alginate O-acetyltransferase complex protein AlgI